MAKNLPSAHPESLLSSGGAQPLPNPPRKKITSPELRSMKRRGERIAALTAFDYPSAALVDAAGIDVVLVGDSLGNVVLGHANTVPVTLDDILHALRAVRRGTRYSLLVADLPFGYCHGNPLEKTIEASVALLKAGAEAVKLEGGSSRSRVVHELVEAEIPVMGHIGLTPQAVHRMGGFRVQGKTSGEAQRLLEDALALEDAGAFAVVLEGIPAEVASRISGRLSIPAIGIGAGESCDGQILVLSDLLGWTVAPPPQGPGVLEPRKPRFVRQYLDLRSLVVDAIRRYAADVRKGEFPGASEAFRLSEAEAPSAV